MVFMFMGHESLNISCFCFQHICVPVNHIRKVWNKKLKNDDLNKLNYKRTVSTFQEPETKVTCRRSDRKQLDQNMLKTMNKQEAAVSNRKQVSRAEQNLNNCTRWNSNKKTTRKRKNQENWSKHTDLHTSSK